MKDRGKASKPTSRLKPLAVAIGLVAIATTTTVAAAPIVLEGNFVRTQISDDGTLGNGSGNPGLLHDRTGTGSFDPNFDYLQPGTPFEGFGVFSNQTGNVQNRNSTSGGSVGGSDGISQVSITDRSGTGADNRVTWTGVLNGFFEIVHDFFFNDDDENVGMTTTITALTDLSGLTFSRAIDPDPDNNSLPGSTASTGNERGLDLNGDGDYDDAGEQAPNRYVSATGLVSDSTIALFTNDPATSNTGIVGPCCSVTTPSSYLSGGDFAPNPLGFDSTADNGIGLAFDLGDLASGMSVAVTYFYVFGDTPGSVGIPDPDPDPPVVGVPVPATGLLLGLGLLAAGASRRRIRG